MSSNLHTVTYLGEVLRDARTPFKYRSRVCRLLGMSRSDHDHASFMFSPSSMPVGFRYRSSYDEGDPEAFTSLLPPVRQAFWPEKTQKNTSSNSVLGTMPDTEGSHSSSDNRESNPDLLKRQTFKLPASSSNNVSLKKISQTHAASNQVVNRQSTEPISVPQIPAKNRENPLPPDGEEKTFQTVVSPDTKSNITLSHESQLDNRYSSIVFNHTTSNNISSHEEESSISNTVLEKSPVTQLSRPFSTPNEDVVSDLTVSNQEYISQPIFPSQALRHRDARSEQEQIKFEDRPPITKNILREVHPVAELSKHETSDRPEGVNSAARTSNQNASYRIDQIRRAVQELTAKRVHAQPTHQTEPSTQVPPKDSVTQAMAKDSVAPFQPIIRVQHTSRRLSIPDAFWERSCLGRLHSRPLR